MRWYKIILSAFSLILLFQQCSSTTEPPIDEIKDPRNYTWTIDTLFHPTSIQTLMRSIWGSSPNDVYTVGHSDEIQGQMWHFDGKRWDYMYFPNGESYELTAVYGFSANDIWVAAGRDYDNPNPPPNFLDSTFIMHYNGSWQYIRPAGGRTLETVWGGSPNNVWFGGLNGTLFHWDGTSVKQDSLPIYIPKNADPVYNIRSIYGKSTGEVYFLQSAPSGQTYLFMYKQNNWSVIDSSAWFRNHLWISEKGTIYETGQVGFYKWTGDSWTNIKGSFDGILISVGATSENNMFLVGYGSSAGWGGKYTGLVYHYNGQDFYLYENLKLNDVEFYDAWTDGTEVFIVGQTNKFPQKTIILHGK